MLGPTLARVTILARRCHTRWHNWSTVCRAGSGHIHAYVGSIKGVESGGPDVRIKDFMPVTEAARRLGLSERRIRQLIEAGRLRAARVTRRLYLVEEGSVAEYARERRPAGRPRKGP